MNSPTQFNKYGKILIIIGTAVILTLCALVGKILKQHTKINAAHSGPLNPELRSVTMTTNWLAQAEHGGFYQAKALGIYEKYGLNVTLHQGNTHVKGIALLTSGATDFYMGHSFGAIRAVESVVPVVTVAAIFQKDPQVLIAHPNSGHDSLEQLKGQPIMVAPSANVSFWPFLAGKFGFTTDQQRPYSFNIAPFLADTHAIQEGILTSEPFTIEQEGHVKPVVFLLADYGYNPYATTIETRQELVDKDPDLVQRFVNASIKGWESYMQNPAPGNALIRKDNPEMSEALLAFGLAKMKEAGIVLSGDAINNRIGFMTAERWKTFFQTMVEMGIFQKGTPYEKAFTLKFIQNLQPLSQTP